MNDHEWPADEFEAHRTHLRGVAYRMLGSMSEADDAVQETWLRLSRSDSSGVENLGGWLTTVVARVCLDVLRSRKSRREEPLDPNAAEPITRRSDGSDPEEDALLGDSVGLAMIVVLEMLSPAERVAYVLHDVFDVPFDDIARVVARSPAAARQLASRARRRIRGAATVPDADLSRRRHVVEAFLAASRDGDFDALLAVLDPDVVLRADDGAVEAGASAETRGAAAVAEIFSGRARAARPAMVDGSAGLVWAPGGQPRIVFSFTIVSGKIVEINLTADPERIRKFNVEVMPNARSLKEMMPNARSLK
jgi:RNA polymerase sigma-70 factor (ECF subfamily)